MLSDAAKPKLQRAVLAIGVVSQSSKRGKAVASDEMLELHNGDYSQDITRFGNSTYDLAATFRNTALNRKAARVVRAAFESIGL